MQFLLSDAELTQARDTLEPDLMKAVGALEVARKLILEFSGVQCVEENTQGYCNECPIAAIEDDERLVCRVDGKQSWRISEQICPLERRYSKVIKLPARKSM